MIMHSLVQAWTIMDRFMISRREFVNIPRNCTIRSLKLYSKHNWKLNQLKGILKSTKDIISKRWRLGRLTSSNQDLEVVEALLLFKSATREISVLEEDLTLINFKCLISNQCSVHIIRPNRTISSMVVLKIKAIMEVPKDFPNMLEVFQGWCHSLAGKDQILFLPIPLLSSNETDRFNKLWCALCLHHFSSEFKVYI